MIGSGTGFCAADSDGKFTNSCSISKKKDHASFLGGKMDHPMDKRPWFPGSSTTITG
jgi:hypothetical protein